jgi:hypothetical protein
MPRDTLRKAVAMVIALLGGAAWVLQFWPHIRSVSLASPVPWLPQFLLLAVGCVITYWLMRLTACSLTEISKDQLVRRLALVFAAFVTWERVTTFLATRPDIQLEVVWAIIAPVVVFGISFVLSYLFVWFTVDRVKP